MMCVVSMCVSVLYKWLLLCVSACLVCVLVGCVSCCWLVDDVGFACVCVCLCVSASCVCFGLLCNLL